MKVIINDASIELNDSRPVLEMAIAYSGVKDFKGLAVAVNNIVIPRTTWNTFTINENDTITIIRATQGG
jgi:sulfur carrier protein